SVRPVSNGLHTRRMPVAHIPIFFPWVEQHDTRLQRHTQRRAELRHARKRGHLGPLRPWTGWRATAREPRPRQVIHAPNHRRCAPWPERDSGQTLPQSRERHPPAVDQHDPSVRTLQRSQYLESCAALVAAVVEEELAAPIETPHHADALKPGRL